MAKKNKKNRPEGFDPNQRKRERIEARRQAKAEALERRRKTERRERIVRRVGIAVLATFALWFFFVRGGVPDAIAGHEVEHYSTSAGNPNHVAATVSYDMSPPVSGQHSANVQPCGTYGGVIQNEILVHMLEHGAVGVVYRTDIAQEEVRRIEEVVAKYDSHTFSAPYDGEMETPIAVLAWANTMRLETFDAAATTQFIEEFRQGGQAPEAYQDCPNESDDDYEVPEPGQSPGASPNPGDDVKASPGEDVKETPKP